MAQFIKAMDQHTMKQIGENLHTEYSVSNSLDEKIVQFFFQLVRNKNHGDLEKLHIDILKNFMKCYKNICLVNVISNYYV